MLKYTPYLVFLLIFPLACMNSSGPSATENTLAGAVNYEELYNVTTGEIWVYLVEFEGSSPVRIDSINPDFTGGYEFSGFDFGSYGVEAETSPSAARQYYGFRDSDRNATFDIGDAITFNQYAYISAFNIPMYEVGMIPDTNESEFEPNDEFVQDLGIIHTVHISGYISEGGFTPPDSFTGDLDLFKFKSVWTGYLTIRLDWTGSANLDLFLYDRSGFDVLDMSANDGYDTEVIDRSIYRHDEFIVLVASADLSAYYELSIRIE